MSGACSYLHTLFLSFVDNGGVIRLALVPIPNSKKKKKSTFFQVPFLFIPPLGLFSTYKIYYFSPPVISCHISDSFTSPYPFLSFFLLFVIVIVFLEELAT